MGKYRLKPIEAFKWDGKEDQTGGPEWIVEALGLWVVEIKDTPNGPIMTYSSKKGNCYATPGDYILKDENGEIYSLDETTFQEKYEQEPIEQTMQEVQKIVDYGDAKVKQDIMDFLRKINGG